MKRATWLIAGSVLAALLAGCGQTSLNVGGSNASPDEDQYTVLLDFFAGPNHAADAEHFKAETERLAGWTDLYIVNKEIQPDSANAPYVVSNLYWGHYRTPKEAAAAMQKAKKWVTPAGITAYKMAMVEVVPGKHTSAETVDVTWKLMEQIGKKPVALKREALGFIGNRLQLALLREALYIVEQGIATPEAVDTTVKYSLGRRLGVTGPLESADLGGLDIFQSISSYLNPDLCVDSGVSPLLSDAAARGDLGAKTGKGFYDWTDAARLGKLKKTRERILIDWLQKDRDTIF